MNFKMYILLFVAQHRGQVKINPNYKNLDFMVKNNYVSVLLDGKTLNIAGFEVPTTSNFYHITNNGRLAMFEYGQKLVTWYISVAALIISFIALAVSLLRLKK